MGNQIPPLHLTLSSFAQSQGLSDLKELLPGIQYVTITTCNTNRKLYIAFVSRSQVRKF